MTIIDINPWQYINDWQSLSEKVDGVLLRVGKWHSLDNSFTMNFNMLNQLGLKIGIYYEGQATNEIEMFEEANQLQDWLIELKRQNELELGVWYMATDFMIKFSSNPTETYMKLYERMGVGLATDYSWFEDNTYDADKLKDAPIWVLDEHETNRLKDEHEDLNIKLWRNTSQVSDELPYSGNVLY